MYDDFPPGYQGNEHTSGVFSPDEIRILKLERTIFHLRTYMNMAIVFLQINRDDVDAEVVIKLLGEGLVMNEDGNT